MAAAKVSPLTPAPITAILMRRSQPPPTILGDEAMDRRRGGRLMSPASSPEERYSTMADELLRNHAVTRLSKETQSKKKFGKSDELRVDDRIFAMLVRGNLVVKIPRDRVDALVTSGDGERFDTGGGRVMKEWLKLNPGSSRDWLALATEAMGFVASKR